MTSRHEVLIGPYRSGKSWSLLERALEHCRTDVSHKLNLDSETLIIVPSQRYRALTEKRLQKLLLTGASVNQTEKTPGLWGLKILTFKQFCEATLLKAGVFAKVLPDAARSALVTDIGKQLVDQGKIEKLAPVINFSGTQAAILALIDEWQASGYSAAQVLKQIEAKEPSGHHIELAQIYSTYAEILQKNNYTDEHGLMFKTIDLLNSNRSGNAAETQRLYASNFVVVDGFDRWHILQLKLLKALAKHVPEIDVSFDYEQPGDNLLEEYAWKETSNEQIKELLGGVFKFTAMERHLSKDCRGGRESARVLPPTIEGHIPTERRGEIYPPAPSTEGHTSTDCRGALHAPADSSTFTRTTGGCNPPLQEPRVIKIFSAGDKLAETAIIAARVKAAIVIDGVNPDEIVVTSRNLKTYKSAFEAAFQDAGLDYCLDESIGLMTLPIVRLWIDLLSLASNDFTRRQVIDCLRSPYFRLSVFNLTAEAVEQLNTKSLDDRIKVVSGQDQWQAATKGDLKLATALKKVFDTVTPPDNIKSALQYATWVEDLFDKVIDRTNIPDHLIDAVNKFRTCLANLIDQEQILRACTSMERHIPKDCRGGLHPPANEADRIDSMSSVGAGVSPPLPSPSPHDPNFYLTRLLELIKTANIPSPTPIPGKVLITGATLVPNQQYKQIYLAGMLEGEFPAHNPGSGFLTPEELGQWQCFGIPIYDPRLEPGFEYALFASLLNRAQQKVILSYPAADITSSKEEPLPSFFITSLDLVTDNSHPDLVGVDVIDPRVGEHGLASFAPTGSSETIGPISFETFTRSANSPRNALAYSLWHKLPFEKLADRHHLFSDFVHQLEEKLSFANKRCQQLSQSPLAGYLTDHVKAGTIKINLPEYWSVSGLNEYGKCPFSYWLTRTLKVEPHAEPETGLSVMEKGNFYHKALELFYKEVIAKKLSMTAENDKELQVLFKEAIATAFEWLQEQGWFRPSEFWAQEKEDLAFHLRNFYAAEQNRFLKENNQFAPFIVEAEFGPQLSALPLIIDKDGKSIKLRGKIDRIDIDTANQSINGPSRLRLIDYKSGSGLPSSSDFESGRNIQLPLYALAAEQTIFPNSYVEACSYLSVRAGSSRTQDGAVLRTYLGTVPDKIFQFVELIEAGDFSLNPSKPENCKTCDHRTICRIKEFPKQLESVEDQEWQENGDD